ncbi:MAG: hypothetical protein OEV30_13510, partial [Ignavibacteria bacterium]|nr:hypothetical protein [Ignavibacteria bacterium]
MFSRIITRLSLVLFLFVFLGQGLFSQSNDPIAYWPFNGNANDESGNGNHGTVYGSMLAEDRFGNPNSAYDFDGVDDYIDFGTDASTLLRESVTISLWMKLA